MDKNTITGFILIAAVLIGFSWWTQPSEEQKAQMRLQDSLENVARVKAEQEKKAAEKAALDKKAQELVEASQDTTALFHNALSGNAEKVVLKNKKLELTLSTKGGTVTKAVIRGYKDQKGNPDVVLFDEKEQQLKFMMAGKDKNIITSDLYFTPSNVTDSTVTMTAIAGPGKALTMEYKLGPSYMLHMNLRTTGMSGFFSPTTKDMDVQWDEKCRQQERGYSFENRYAALTYHKADGGTDKLNDQKDEKDVEIDRVIDWVCFKTQFFSAVMIAKDDFQKNALMTSLLQEKGSGYLKDYSAKLKTAFDPSGQKASEFEFYYGPNDFRTLNGIEDQSTFGKELQLERLVYLGWWIIRPINRWFTLYIFDWLTSFGFNMGIVLILITLLLKAITYPLVKKSYMSSAKMRVLKPKLDEATKQFDKPEDQMQKQQAMMAEYSKYGVSPLSGCLPMLIQMPIWMAMFFFVPNAIQLRGEKFLWMDDLSTYDPLFEWGTHIWGIGDHLSLTCILFCGAQILYSWFSMQQQKDQMVGQQAEQMKIMQYMMYLMPLMFFFIFNEYSSGLNFYYFISLFFSAAIMFTLRKTTNDAKLLAILEKKYQENKNNPKKMSGMAARIEQMQKQTEELRKLRMEQEKMKKNK